MSDGAFRYHKYMIKSAPYGELQNVIDNLNKISPIDLESPQVQQTLKQYNQEHLTLLKLPHHQTSFPITSFSRNQNGHYIDQLNKKSYQINHLTHQLQHQEQATIQLPEAVTQFLEILSPKINKYVGKYFRQPYGSQVYMQVTEQGSLNVHIAFTSKNVQLGNFCTGQWSSVWLVNKSKIEGKISIRSHIFESGNVQMNQDKTISEDFEFTADMEENSNKIVKVIQGFESKVQKNLSHIYEEMPNGFFKHLRRIVPVTKVKMVWNVHALKMNKNLQQAKK